MFVVSGGDINISPDKFLESGVDIFISLDMFVGNEGEKKIIPNKCVASGVEINIAKDKFMVSGRESKICSDHLSFKILKLTLYWAKVSYTELLKLNLGSLSVKKREKGGGRARA